MAIPRWVRILALVVLAAVAVVVLFEWVFPWVETTYYNPSVG
jgi:lipopolysaccharide export LptBFGC system permease protein LptF